jgi:formate dehydrogenase subunit delta
MDVERLIVMANDIAAFFHSAASPDQAVEQVAAHLRLYWHPSMRTQLIAHYRTGGAGLSTVAAGALRSLESKARHATDSVVR